MLTVREQLSGIDTRSLRYHMLSRDYSQVIITRPERDTWPFCGPESEADLFDPKNFMIYDTYPRFKEYKAHQLTYNRAVAFNQATMSFMAGCLFKLHRKTDDFPGFIELIYCVTRPELSRCVSEEILNF